MQALAAKPWTLLGLVEELSKSLTPEQKVALPGLVWLQTAGRGSGKSHALLMAALVAAVSHPNRKFELVDHTRSRYTFVAMQMHSLLETLPPTWQPYFEVCYTSGVSYLIYTGPEGGPDEPAAKAGR